MKRTIVNFSLTLCLLSFVLISCKKSDDDNTIAIDGRYTLASATFDTAVDLDGAGPNPATTDAGLVLANGLFGTSPCSPKTIANVYVEFANNTDFNIVCANSTTTLAKVGTWNYNGTTNTITLTNIVIPNPNFDNTKPVSPSNSQTVTLPIPLSITNISATNTNGVIKLTGKMVLPYNASFDTAGATIVLNKIS